MSEKTTAALVTGAAQGIGKAIAERLADEEQYDLVACVDIQDTVEDTAASVPRAMWTNPYSLTLQRYSFSRTYRYGEYSKSGIRRCQFRPLSGSIRPLSGSLRMRSVGKHPTAPHTPDTVTVDEVPGELCLVLFRTAGALQDGCDDHTPFSINGTSHKGV
jgi:hypothetical protein